MACSSFLPLLGSWGGKCQILGNSCNSWQSALAKCEKTSISIGPRQGVLWICSFPLFARFSVASLGGDLLRFMLTRTAAHLGFFSVQPLQTLLCTGPLCHPNAAEFPGTVALGACPHSCLWPCSLSLTALLQAWASPVATYAVCVRGISLT